MRPAVRARHLIGRLTGVSLVASLLLVGSAPAVAAATPPEGAPINAPSSGTVVRTWSGTAPGPSTGSLAACVAGVNSDLYKQEITLPPGDFYDQRVGWLEVRIDWSPSGGNIATQDLALVVVTPSGDQVDSDGGAPREAVTIVDPEAGEYEIYVCSFLTVLPQPYKGVVRLTIAPKTSTANPPSTPTSLRFGPITIVDPQRDVAEPSLRIDKDANEYACGPFGASRASEFAQKSEDRGDTWRILGQQPEGRIAPGGGGDCELSVGRVRNADGYYTLSYTGLAALVNFSTSRSTNAGRSFVGNAVSESPVVVDRQWMDTVGANTVYLTYRQIPLGSFVQRSIDGGLTYGPGTLAIPEISISGNLIVDNRPGREQTVYIAHTFGNDVRVARSTNAAAATPSYTAYTVKPGCAEGAPETPNCVAGDPSSIFPSLAQDSAGNLYMAWTEAGTYNTYYSWRAAPSPTADLSTGWSPKIQVNRDQVFTTVLPWIEVGDPGRIAVSFYGTVVDGNPEVGSFRGPWHVYVNTSTNAMSAPGNVRMSQTRATTHPIHWNSLCISGLGCNVSGGDRTLLDFFQVRGDPQGRIRVTYNQSNKHYTDALGRIAIVSYSKQIAGPGLRAGPNPPVDTRPVVAFARSDPAGDARYPFSVFPSPVAPPSPPFRTNYAALDFRELRATRGTTPDGRPGVTFTLKLADLSPTALATAQAGLQSPNLLYVARFFSGFEGHAAVASVSPSGAFSFGYTDLALSPDSKLEIYPQQTTIPGTVNTATGEIRMTVPYSLIPHVAVASDPAATPLQRAARAGDRIFSITGFSFGNPGGAPNAQYFLNQADSSAAFDYILGSQPTMAPPPPVPAVSISDATVTEPDTGTVNAAFTIRLARAHSSSITVNYATSNGSARAGSDYAAEQGSVTFAPGQTTKSIGIAVRGDRTDEPNERFFVTLTGSPASDNQGVGTIVDDDAAPSLRVNDPLVTERDSTTYLPFTITLSSASGKTVSVSYRTRDGSARAPRDYTARSGTVTFRPGETSKRVSIAIRGENVREDTERFYLDLSSPVNASLADATGIGYIRDDDPDDPVVVLRKSGPTSAAPGAFVTYTLSWQNLGPLTSHNASVVDTLPAGVRFSSASGGGVYETRTHQVRWSLGDVGVGVKGSRTVAVFVPRSVPDGTVLVNTADFYGEATLSATAVAATTVRR